MGAFSGSVVSEVSRSYNSLSGTDIRAVIGNLTFAEIQAISYSITREKAPLYTMGSPDPRAFSRNKRGIAGSLVWINFDRHALLALINTQGGTFVANVDDIRPQYTVTESNFIGQTVTFNSTITNADGTAGQRHHRTECRHAPLFRLRLQSPGHPLGLRPDPALRHHPGRVQ